MDAKDVANLIDYEALKRQLAEGGGGIDTSDATAILSDILLGKTAYVNGVKVAGNLVVSAPAEPLYRDWSGYPSSPFLTSAYPYQLIFDFNGNSFLCFSTGKFWYDGTDLYSTAALFDYKALFGSNPMKYWEVSNNSRSSLALLTSVITECNYDVYTSAALTTVFKEKTTP